MSQCIIREIYSERGYDAKPREDSVVSSAACAEGGGSKEVSVIDMKEKDVTFGTEGDILTKPSVMSQIGLKGFSDFSFQPCIQPSSDDIMKNYKLTPNDSNDPSYSNLKLPYPILCRKRYKRAGEKMRAQFIKEIQCHELLQNKALDGVRIHREFCNIIVKPISPNEMVKLTEIQKAKIEQLLAAPDERH